MCEISGGNDAICGVFQNSKRFAWASVDISNILYFFPYVLYTGKRIYNAICNFFFLSA